MCPSPTAQSAWSEEGKRHAPTPSEFREEVTLHAIPLLCPPASCHSWAWILPRDHRKPPPHRNAPFSQIMTMTTERPCWRAQ